jgi:hypothetical protein
MKQQIVPFFFFFFFENRRDTRMSDVLRKCVSVDETVPESQDSISLMADAMEICLRCDAVWGTKPADMPTVSVLLLRFADLWRGGSVGSALEMNNLEMNLAEFVLFCLVCAVGRPTSGFTSVADAKSIASLPSDAFYEAFRRSPDVRRTQDMAHCKSLPPVCVNVVEKGGRIFYPHVHTIFSSPASSGSSTNSASAVACPGDDGDEIADVRAVVAAVFHAAKALLANAECGNYIHGDFYEACFRKYFVTHRYYDLRLIDRASKSGVGAACAVPGATGVGADSAAVPVPWHASFLLRHTGVAKPSCCLYVILFIFLKYFNNVSCSSEHAMGCEWRESTRSADTAIKVTRYQLRRHNAFYRLLMQCMDVNLPVGDALVERIRSEALARLVQNYPATALASSAAPTPLSWPGLVASRRLFGTHWNNVQTVFMSRSGVLLF